jgi:hypothetical protein
MSISRNHYIRALLGFYATQNGSLLPQFRDKLPVPFSRGLGPTGGIETSAQFKLLVIFTTNNRQFAAEAIQPLLSTTKFTAAPSLNHKIHCHPFS